MAPREPGSYVITDCPNPGASEIFTETQVLGRRYPKSPRANEAKSRLKDVQKLLRDKKACI